MAPPWHDALGALSVPTRIAVNCLSASCLALEDQLGAGAALDDLARDDALLDAGQRGDLVHDVEHDFLDDGAQAARARVAPRRLLGDRGQRVGPEVELDALELEQPMVLLGER